MLFCPISCVAFAFIIWPTESYDPVSGWILFQEFPNTTVTWKELSVITRLDQKKNPEHIS
jgi:hypothetical protein